MPSKLMTAIPVAGLFAPVAGAIAKGYAFLAAAWSAVSEGRRYASG